MNNNWIKTTDQLPPIDTNILIYGINSYGKGRTLKGFYLPPKYKEDDDDYEGESIYDEKQDTYYWPGGYYEALDSQSICYPVDYPITDWQALPHPPSK